MITLREIVLRRGAKVLLDRVSTTINPGEKVGLVGRNGAGKSTLFALFSGALHEDGGDISIPAQWQLAQVEQNMPETSEPATAFVLGGDTRLMKLREELTRAEDSGDGMAIAHAHSDLGDAGEHDAVPRAQSLILGLGFKAAELDNPVNSFSGGWRMRLQLARALMCPSDLLLLDEPTNHLDLDALVWLEAWLKRYAGTLIVISHDREFLDAVTDVTLHIDHQKLVRYGGNYSAFETLRAQQLSLQQATFSKQQEKIAHLQKFIDRFKAKASKAKQAQSRVKALERMEKIAPVLADAEFSFEFKEPANLPNPMLAISDAAFGYGPTPDDDEDDDVRRGGSGAPSLDEPDSGSTAPARTDAPVTILRNVNRTVLAGQRIGILGANGQGKSTLVKTIARTMPPLEGTVTEGKGLAIGYFAQQELDVLRPKDSPLEHMRRLAREMGPALGQSDREQDLRNWLGQFVFTGDMVNQAVGSMSGGEKARLVLAMLVWQRPNLLLLDEPTNHLDLSTREALSVALNEFEGTVMLVSHDRALLRSVCDEFWLVGRGVVKPFDGDLDDYQQYLLDEAKRLREEASGKSRAAAAAANAANAAKAANAAGAASTATPTAGTAGSRPTGTGPAVAKNSAPARAPAPGASRSGAGTRAPGRSGAPPARGKGKVKRELDEIEARIQELEAEKASLESSLGGLVVAGEIAEVGKRLAAVAQQLHSAEERWLVLSQELEAIG